MRALSAFCSALRAARSWARDRSIAESSAVWMALTWRCVAVRTTFDWLRVAFALGTAGAGDNAVQRRLLRGEVGLLLLEDLSGRKCVDLGQHVAGRHVITDPDSQ